VTLPRHARFRGNDEDASVFSPVGISGSIEQILHDWNHDRPHLVMAGLDPAISGPHWIAGSSPAMTACGNFQLP
jgi:hypothetical protein